MENSKLTKWLLAGGVVVAIIIIGVIAYISGLLPGTHSLAGTTAATTSPLTSSVGLTPVTPGTSGVLLGIHVYPGNGETASEADFTSFEQSIGHQLAIDSEYYGWNELGDSDNTTRIAWDKQNGLLPMESWRPLLNKNPNQKLDTCAPAKEIMSGADDAQIKKQADTLKGYGIQILLRWNYEMTDNEYNYCFNNGVDVTPSNYPTAGPTYVAVWKHIHDIFTAEGATNISWVWSPAASVFSKGGSVDSTDWKLFYPGDNYVDWIAEDHYNKTDTPQSWSSDRLIQNFYSQVSGLGKPLMQSETGAQADPNKTPDAQTEWVTTLFTGIQTQYPAFRAVVYWDGDQGDGKDGGVGYHLIGPGLAAFKTFAAKAPFNVIAQLSKGN